MLVQNSESLTVNKPEIGCILNQLQFQSCPSSTCAFSYHILLIIMKYQYKVPPTEKKNIYFLPILKNWPT